MRIRASKRLAIAAALAFFAALPVTMAPLAQADDPLAPIIFTVNRDRQNNAPTCPLKYNQQLADIAFASAQLIPQSAEVIEEMKSRYNGEVQVFVGTGDPQAAATTSAYRNGAGPLVSNCDWTEFGVSFYRFESEELDWVGIAFGKPVAVPQPPDPGTGTEPGTGEVVPPPPVKCLPGGPKTEVPAGETCPPPANAVRVEYVPGLVWTVNVTNSAGIGGSCTYRASYPNGSLAASKDFNIPPGPNGKATFTVLAPAPFVTYKVVTSCTGTYDNRPVEFGHVEQTVP